MDLVTKSSIALYFCVLSSLRDTKAMLFVV